MALRPARRKNLFLNTLKQQTYAYMNEQNRALKGQLRQIVVNTKEVVKNATKRPFRKLTKQGVIRYYHKGKEVRESDSNFGKVYADAEQLPARLRETLNNVMNKYSELILKESKKLVPVDKRYNKLNTKDSVEVKKYRNRGIIEISGLKDIDLRNRTKGDRTFRRFYMNRIKGTSYQWSSITAGSGWYTGEQAEFIKKYLSGSNRRSIYNVYYNSQEGKIFDFAGNVVLNMNGRGSMSLDLKGEKDVMTSRKQPSFGYQELKNSGKIDKMPYGYRITYSAFDETRPAGDRYNYAALQHDNLAFKHKYGQALYLSEPVKFYKDKYLKEAGKRLKNDFKKGV